MTELQVIGAGLGRTGTESFRTALIQLGFDPCHHMQVAFGQPERNYLYKKVAADPDDDESIKAIFAGYKALCDYPGCIWFEKFAEWNPDAKVVLTVRDSPDQWAKSAGNTIFAANQPASWFARVRNYVAFKAIFLIKPMFYTWVQAHGRSPWNPSTDLAQLYSDWNRRVVETIPAERLLVFNVKEGWGPLCKFLGCPVPDTPFPRGNSTTEWKNASSGKGSSVVVKVVKVVLLGAAGVLGALYLRDYLQW